MKSAASMEDGYIVREIDDEYVPQYVLPTKLGFACSMQPEIRARCHRKQRHSYCLPCDDCSQKKEGCLRKEEIGVSTPDSVLDWSVHADFKQWDKDSCVKGGGDELYYPEDRLPAQITVSEKDMIGGLGEGNFKLDFRADSFYGEESEGRVLDRLSICEQSLQLKSLFTKAWKSGSHEQCTPSLKYRDKSRLRFTGDEREIQSTYADKLLKSVARKADQELLELASEVKDSFTSKKIKELDNTKHFISQAVSSSKANVVQPAMTASSQGNTLKSEVGHCDSGTQPSRKPIQSTQATMPGEIQNLFSSSSHVLLAAEPLEGSFFVGDVGINSISHYRPWQHPEKPSQLQLHIPTKEQFTCSDSLSSFDQGKGKWDTSRSTIVTSEPVKCWSKVPMPYTGLPISMSDHACWPENSIFASLSSDVVEISKIGIYEDSTKFKKYNNKSEGRDSTLKRNQNDMGSNKRQKTVSCYVPSMWHSPAAEIDKGMVDNQCFEMRFSDVEQRRQRREVPNGTKIENFESSVKHSSMEQGSNVSCPPVSRDICMTLGELTTTSVVPTVQEQSLSNTAPYFTEKSLSMAKGLGYSHFNLPILTPEFGRAKEDPQLLVGQSNRDSKTIEVSQILFRNKRDGNLAVNDPGIINLPSVQCLPDPYTMNCTTDLDSSFVTKDHLFEGLNEKQRTAIQQETRRIKEQNKMFNARKLSLVLDLDHTLLNSAMFSDIEPVHEEMLKIKEEKDQESPHRHLFRLPNIRMWTKLRPGIWQFLDRASKLYELHVYTMGSRVYATEMTKILDPTGKLFAGRVISKGDEVDVGGFGISSKSKDLDGVMGMESSAIVIDDTEKMWPHHRPNLIVVERYTYFPCSRRQFGLAGPSLFEIDHDEGPEDGMLASTLRVIEEIHNDFFSKKLLSEVDVRDLLATKQHRVLMGCRIVFSRVFPMEEAQPHLNHLWRVAEKFGAECTTQIDEHVTHVVAISLGTSKVNWGLATGRHVVCTGWLETSALFYRRENERDFPVTTWQQK